jgi:hypothetical protein
MPNPLTRISLTVIILIWGSLAAAYSQSTASPVIGALAAR